MRHVFIIFLLLLPAAARASTFVFINNNAIEATQAEHFVSSTPMPNQVMDLAPDTVIITFSLPIRADKSSIRVYDLYGTQITDGSVTVSGTAMTANLPPLSSGKYAVKWKTRCLCDEVNDLSDEFHFTVR